jgi:SAM-dependent methyltransferase
MDEVQARQGDEYVFPYHYLPQVTERGFRSYRSWGWSLNYVTALRLVGAQVAALAPASLIDIGCGDGALVHHIRKIAPEMRLAGIDYDERPIAFARAFTPGVEFVSGDIGAANWPEPFDTATLVEVIEHIPPAELPGFMAHVRRVMSPTGWLIVTVPHVNKPVEAKHYRHFSFASLTETLDGFDIVDMFGFERLASWKRQVFRLADNRLWFAELKPLNRLMLQHELSFREKEERGCGRIFALARPKRAQ